jgi:DNA-binding FrmR family transcriptional regulator
MREEAAMRQIYPNHEAQLVRLSKIEGQLKGIRRMIEERRYCVEIAQQVRAVSAALEQVKRGVLEKHIRHCVKDAAKARDPERLEEKLDEVMRVLGKLE